MYNIYHYQDEATVVYHEIEYEIKGNMWDVHSKKKYVSILEYKGVRHTYYTYDFFIAYDKGDHVLIDVKDKYCGDEYKEENVYYRDFSLAAKDRRAK